jgi:hypothetical protein
MRISFKLRWLLTLGVFLAAALLRANADATLLLEEPYGHFGAFTSTGHAAVYLNHVCAESPIMLRPCLEGEAGIVISRYNRLDGYDWVAIPLLPYLYAVDRSDDIPLYANPKIVAFLRNEYRKKYLRSIAPDAANGEPPEGNWTQLTGAAYDRTIYGYTIETTPEKDAELIAAFNDRPNRSHFNLIFHNCADFAKSVINFYYPHTLHRNMIADIGITTPKQISKLLVKYSAKHPELQSSSFVIPQVPGSLGRSTPVHGVVESLLKAKKYVVPVAILHPVVTAFMAAAYVGGDGRFDPAKHTMVSESGQELEPPLAAQERRAYQSEMSLLLTSSDSRREARDWARLEVDGEPRLDQDGRPALRLRVDGEPVDIGISRENIAGAPPEVASELMAARLRMELQRGSDSHASATQVMDDWKLLQQFTSGEPGED